MDPLPPSWERLISITTVRETMDLASCVLCTENDALIKQQSLQHLIEDEGLDISPFQCILQSCGTCCDEREMKINEDLWKSEITVARDQAACHLLSIRHSERFEGHEIDMVRRFVVSRIEWHKKRRLVLSFLVSNESDKQLKIQKQELALMEIETKRLLKKYIV
jgi:uncharacterized protein YuzB (UPF0349 family)